MVLSGLALAIVALLGWIWLSRGFFPAFLNMMCCIAAGAIAFGVWEPLAYMMLDKVNGNDAVAGVIWAIALGLPFAVSMAILRAIVDVCIPANMKFDKAADAVGGALCGAVSGVITAGILIISMAFLRVERDFMDYNNMAQQANGSLKTDKGLMFPVDTITAAFYKKVSSGAFATSTPLARWYPDLEYVPHAMRLSFGRGKARNSINTKDFDVWRRFTVGGKETSLSDTLKDDWNPKVAQSIADLEGQQYPAGTVLNGFILNFQPSARERSGSVVLGNAQIRLLVEKAGESPDYKTIYPVSVISQASSEKRAFARFRFDAPDTFISSIGGASETRMGFEFPVPPGYEPIALYIKNTRVAIPADKKPVAYATAGERDSAVRTGKLFDQPAEADSITLNQPAKVNAKLTDQEMGIRFSSQLPVTIQRGTERGLSSSEDMVLEGHEMYEKKIFDKTRGLDRNLRIDHFQTKPDTVLLQLDVGPGTPLTWLGKVPVTNDSTYAPQIVDTDGTVYEPVGYIYEEQAKYLTIHFNRGQPIRTVTDLPPLSATREDQKLTIIFDISKGVKISKFQLGGTTLHEFKPPMAAEGR